MWPTRKGTWRSRAGGVYLPPEANIERQGSPSLSPARWMYPEEFNRPLQRLGNQKHTKTFSSFGQVFAQVGCLLALVGMILM